MFLNFYYLKKKNKQKSITESNINYEYTLLEFYDKSDQPVHIKYFIIQSKKN